MHWLDSLFWITGLAWWLTVVIALVVIIHHLVLDHLRSAAVSAHLDEWPVNALSTEHKRGPDVV